MRQIHLMLLALVMCLAGLMMGFFVVVEMSATQFGHSLVFQFDAPVVTGVILFSAIGVTYRKEISGFISRVWNGGV